MSIQKAILKNGVASAIQKVVKVLEQLLLVPFFISEWGTAYYGEWITLTIIPSVLAFSDLGFGSAAANTFVLRFAANDKQGASSVAKGGFMVISLLILLSILLSCGIVGVMNHYDLFSKSVIDKDDATWAVLIMMISKVLNFYQQIFEAYFRAARKASLSTNLVSSYSAATLIGGMMVLVLGGGIVAFAICTLVISVIFNIFYAWRAINVLSIGGVLAGNINKKDITDIGKRGMGFLMSPLWQLIYFQGTTFVVRVTLGAESVAVFNTVRTVSRSANQAFGMINSSVFPEFQFEIGAGRIEYAKKLFRLAILASLLVALSGMFILAIWGPWLYEVWTQNSLNPPSMMWNVFILGIGLNAVWWTAGMTFRAVNQPFAFAFVGVISSLISVILSYFLSKRYGLNGAAFGSLALDLLMALYVLPASCRLINQDIFKLSTEAFRDAKIFSGKFKKLYQSRFN